MIYEEILPLKNDSFIKKTVREAVKAIYALGLDFGQCTIGIKPNGKLVLLDIAPLIDLTPRMSSLLAAAIHDFHDEMTKEAESKSPVILGADPEFILRRPEGLVVPASRYLPKKGELGCDSIVLRSRRKLYPLVELRPSPHADPEKVAWHIGQLLQRAQNEIHDTTLLWQAGGMPAKGLPLGGHIHISGVMLNSHLLRVLDNYAALPLMMLEGDTAVNRRPRFGYLGDFRRQPHGGFEYRTLPSWLISPELTKGALALTKIIAQHYRSLPYLPLQSAYLRQQYYKGNKQTLKPVVKQVWAEIEKLPSYKKYEALLFPLKIMIFSDYSWDEQADIRLTWKVGMQEEKIS